MTQSKPGAFEVGRNLAMTPGKVIHETPLYQLIQYAPTTETVLETPVVVFPPWINRFYILDLTPEKSFVKWAVDQGLSLVHGQLEIGRREPRRRRPRRLCAGPDRRDRHDPRRARRRGGARDRLLRRGDDVRRDAGVARSTRRGGEGQVRDLLHRAGRFLRSGRFEAVPRRRDDGAAVPGHRRQGLSRRALHGGDLQPAARPRPHLELCRQQLSAGRGADAVRPAPLERRHDQPAGGLAPRLSRVALQGQQIDRERRDFGRRARRSTSARSRRRAMSRPGARTISRRPKACGKS